MAEATTATLPPGVGTPPAAGAPAPAARPSVAETAARSTVNVSSLPKGDPSLQPPKPGSARAKMAEELRQKYGTPGTSAERPGAAAAAEPKPGQEEERPADQQVEEPAPGSEEAAAKAQAEAEAAAKAAKDPKAGKPGKVSPWKLLEQFKTRALSAEARAAELEKSVVPPEKAKETSERLTAYEKQVQEMQDELRFFNAEKYDPEVLKANENYERTWRRALGELKELTITDPNSGQARALSPEDMLELVNMPLQHAREVATKLFGEFADDVMAQRKEIRTALEQKFNLLETLKKTGAERDRQRAEAQQKAASELAVQVKQVYESAIAEALAHPEHGALLKPREGDKDYNAKLEKAIQFVESAYSQSPGDPRLTPAERAEVVRKHAAVRNRAIAYSTLRHDLAKVRKELEAANKELAEFKKTNPDTTGREQGAAAAAPAGGMSGLKAALRARAH